MVKPTSKKSKLKAGSVKENLDTNDECLDKILHTFNLKMEVAMQNIPN